MKMPINIKNRERNKAKNIELRCTITKMRILLNSRCEQVGGIIQLKGKTIKIIESEGQTGKRMKKIEQSLRHLWGTINKINVCLMGIPEIEVRKK